MNTENFTLNVSLTIPAEPCTMEGRPRDYHAMNELRGIFWAAYCARANYREGSGSEIALAYIRDKAESHSVTRLHLKEVAKAGILKSGGPITLKEAVRDVLVAETKVPNT